MKRLRSLSGCLMSLLLAAIGVGMSSRPLSASGPERRLPAPLGIRLDRWELPSSKDGQPWSLERDGRDARAVVVLFLGTQCPVNNLYIPVLAEIQRKYRARGVLFVGINSNAQDDVAAVRRHAEELDVPFPMLKDAGARVADRFAAARTPEAFVLDATRIVRYRGRIDDRFDKGVQRAEAGQHDLADALDAVLAGRAVKHPVTEPAGCRIARPPHAVRPTSGTPITYTEHAARLFQQHCQECHRPGEAGPFSLLTYKDAAGWSAAIAEAVQERRMPPWHADPAHGVFRNARRLSDADRATLLAWVEQGCVHGDPEALPPPRTFVRGWRIGKPDAVFTMRKPFAVPAVAPRGGVPYQFVAVSDPFPEEKWVQAVECRPEAASVVHHITAFLIPPGTDIHRWQKRTSLEQLLDSYSDDGFLAGYGPGEDPLTLPAGQAKRIPKGARIALELHYTPNGTACSDSSYVGLVYASEAPQHAVRTGSALQPLLLIPPGAASYRVAASHTFHQPAMLLSLCPHMHVRAKDAAFTLIRPDGSHETLLSVPRYDFNWQTNYYLAKPLPVPKGSKIEFVVHYDNSSGNPNNPNPKAFVTWGEQSWDEMMIGFFEYYWDDAPAGSAGHERK